MNGNPEVLSGRIGGRAKKEVLEIIESLAVAIFLALLIRAFVIQAFSIPSGSMENTLQVHDMLLANKFIYRFRTPRPGDVIIFKFPKSIELKQSFNFFLFSVPMPEFVRKNEMDPENQYFNLGAAKAHYPTFFYTWKDFIKRVVAVEGDNVEIKNNKVFVNGVPKSEPYIKEPPNYVFPGESNPNVFVRGCDVKWPKGGRGGIRVPEGCVFALGDNRNNSEDGHVWGFLPLHYVRGKALVIYWPPSRMGVIR